MKETSVQRESALANAQDALNMKIADLTVQLAALEKELKPFLLPEIPEATEAYGSAAPEPMRSENVEFLHSAYRKVDSIQRVVNSLLTRLQS